MLGPKGLAKKLAKDTGKVAVGVPEDIIRGKVKLEPSTEPPLMPAADKAITFTSPSSDQPSHQRPNSTPNSSNGKENTKCKSDQIT